MQFPFNLNYYSKYNRAKDKRSIKSLRSLVSQRQLQQQGSLSNLERQNEKFLAHNLKKNLCQKNGFLKEKRQEKKSIQSMNIQKEVMTALNYYQEDSQLKQSEQPINSINHNVKIRHVQSQLNQSLFQESFGQPSIDYNFIDSESCNFNTKTKQQSFPNSEAINSLKSQIPQTIESFQQALSQIAALPLVQQQQQIQQMEQMQLNDLGQLQFPDIISHCKFVLHQDDFLDKEPNSIIESQNNKKQVILDSSLEEIAYFPVSVIAKINQKRTNFKNILQQNKSTVNNQQFIKKKNKQLLDDFFESNR